MTVLPSDILDIIDFVGAGEQPINGRCAQRLKAIIDIGYTSPQGESEMVMRRADMSSSGIAFALTMEAQLDAMLGGDWIIRVRCPNHDILSFEASFVRINQEGWPAFKFHLPTPEVVARIETLVAHHQEAIDTGESINLCPDRQGF